MLGEPRQHRLDDPLVERAVELVGAARSGRPLHRLEGGERAADRALLLGRDTDDGERDTERRRRSPPTPMIRSRLGAIPTCQTSTFTAFFIQNVPTVIMTTPMPSMPQPIGLWSIGCK